MMAPSTVLGGSAALPIMSHQPLQWLARHFNAFKPAQDANLGAQFRMLSAKRL
jgi:hypothetical protein